MLWGWLDWIINRRQIREDLREMDELCELNEAMTSDLGRQVRECFTPDEWEAVRERHKQRELEGWR